MVRDPAIRERPALAVVVPVFNEVEVLPAFLDALLPVLQQLTADFEVVLVDDGSTDGSAALIRGRRVDEPRLTLLQLSRNFGHQTAISAGMEHARGDAVIVMDADLQDPPAVLPQLVTRWREGADIVYAIRTERREDGWFKRLSARVFYRLLAQLAPIEIPVDAGDFRLMSRRAVDALRRMPERARYVRGMVAWLGFPVAHVHFRRDPRAAGTTKYPLRRMIRFAADGMLSFSTLPLRLATSLGFLMSLAAITYFLYAVAMKLLVGTAIQGWTSLVAVIALIGSAQLVCLGIIGEYIARIYDEVKARPLYLVQALERGPARAEVDAGVSARA